MLIKVSHKSHQRAAAQHSAPSTKIGSEPVPVRKGTKISSRFCRNCANPFFSRSARLGVVVFAQALKIDLFTTIESPCYEHCTALQSERQSRPGGEAMDLCRDFLACSACLQLDAQRCNDATWCFFIFVRKGGQHRP